MMHKMKPFFAADCAEMDRVETFRLACTRGCFENVHLISAFTSLPAGLSWGSRRPTPAGDRPEMTAAKPSFAYSIGAASRGDK
jgi:hypothetical protein